jgi:hypothetical protein
VLTWELRSIVDRCTQALSVAEIAAYTDVPLGVARVFVGDLLADGLVAVSDLPSAASPTPPRHDLDLLERVLHGLRTL